MKLLEYILDLFQTAFYLKSIFLQEITSFLFDENKGHAIYDLILSGDALVYFGDLTIIFKGVKQLVQHIC